VFNAQLAVPAVSIQSAHLVLMAICYNRHKMVLSTANKSVFLLAYNACKESVQHVNLELTSSMENVSQTSPVLLITVISVLMAPPENKYSINLVALDVVLTVLPALNIILALNAIQVFI